METKRDWLLRKRLRRDCGISSRALDYVVCGLACVGVREAGDELMRNYDLVEDEIDAFIDQIGLINEINESNYESLSGERHHLPLNFARRGEKKKRAVRK